MLDSLVEAARMAGAKVISEARYHFGHNSSPGFAAVILLVESHCTAHSYADVANHRVGAKLPAARFRYGVRTCPEPVQWGGLSGCSYSEGVSWGKFVPPSEGGRFAEVHADATLVWPLLMKAVFEQLDNPDSPNSA